MEEDSPAEKEIKEVKPKVEKISPKVEKPAKTKEEVKIKKEPQKKLTKKPPRRKSTDVKDTKKSSKSTEELKKDILSAQEKLLDKYKGPFARVQGNLEDVRWSNIINNANDSLDPNQENCEKQENLDQIVKLTGFGYNLTTLSNKYDPRNVDESWICVFCRKPSHYGGLGDLFGPYFIPSTQWKSLHLPSPVKQSKSDLASSFILGKVNRT